MHPTSSYRSRYPALSVALAFAVFGACTATQDLGQTNGSADAGASPDAAVTAPFGSMALAVHAARQSKGIAKYGTLELAVSLANGVGNSDLLLNQANYKLRLRSGVVKRPIVHAVGWVSGSKPSPTDLLAPGASYGPWVLSFDVDASQDPPVQLSFEVPGLAPDAPPARVASAPVRFEPCTPCGAICTYLDVDTENCGACGVNVPRCTDGNPVCATGEQVCTDRCVNLSRDLNHCGTCGQKVPLGGSCLAGRPTCPGTGGAVCNGVCKDLDVDPDNCGSCGTRVPIGAQCVGRVPVCPGARGTSCNGTCEDLATDVDHCDSCDQACPQVERYATRTCVASRCGKACLADATLTSAGTCTQWEKVWVPAGISGEDVSLFGLWGASATNLWAVGSGVRTGQAYVARSNGSTWQTSSTGYAGELRAVWGSGPSDVWAVGTGVNGGGGLKLHWNGSTWSNTSAIHAYHGVWGSGPNDVWAVGRNYSSSQALVEHWDGSTWSAVSMPSLPGSVLESVWGSGPNDVWAVGEKTLHWNGSLWSVASSSGATSIWGSGPNDVWAVEAWTLHRWNGSRWSSTQNVSTKPMRAIWGTGPNEVWVVGGASNSRADSAAVTSYWNGSRWTQHIHNTGSTLSGVWGSGPDNVWAISDWGTSQRLRP